MNSALEFHPEGWRTSDGYGEAYPDEGVRPRRDRRGRIHVRAEPAADG